MGNNNNLMAVDTVLAQGYVHKSDLDLSANGGAAKVMNDRGASIGTWTKIGVTNILSFYILNKRKYVCS